MRFKCVACNQILLKHLAINSSTFLSFLYDYITLGIEPVDIELDLLASCLIYHTLVLHFCLNTLFRQTRWRKKKEARIPRLLIRQTAFNQR